MKVSNGFFWCDNCLSLHRTTSCPRSFVRAARDGLHPKFRDRLEQEAQAGVLEYLRLRGDLFHWRQNSLAMKVGRRFVKSGRTGTSDILCCQAPNGRLVAIEMKKWGEKPTPAQLDFGANVIICGGLWFVSFDIPHCEEMLGPVPALHKVKLNVMRKRVYEP